MGHGEPYYGDGYFGILPSGNVDIYPEPPYPPTPCATAHGWYPQLGQVLHYYTADGSFLHLEILADGNPSPMNQTWTLYFPDGRRVVNDSNGRRIIDANGNGIEIIYGCEGQQCENPYTLWRDDAGREIRLQTTATLGSWREDKVTVNGPNGPATWTIDWQYLGVGQDGRKYYVGGHDPNIFPELLEDVNSGAMVVKYIQLPLAAPFALGQTPPADLAWNRYEFGYRDNDDIDNKGYGQLDFMKVPSGARYEYEYHYDGANNVYVDELAHNNWVKKKTITGLTDYNGNSLGAMVWTYDFGGINSWSSEITNPDGGRLVYNFGGRNLPGWDSGLITRINQPDGGVTKRAWAQNYIYDHRGGQLNQVANNPYVQKETVTIVNSAGQPIKTAVANFVYDKNGNLLSRTDYDDWVAYAGPDNIEPNGNNPRITSYSYYVDVPEASVITDTSSAYWKTYASPFWSGPSGRRLNAVLGKTIGNGSAISAATKYLYDAPYTRGNVIYELRCDSAKPPGYCVTVESMNADNSQVLHREYDSFGNLTDIYEPEVRTHYTYDSSGTHVVRVDQGYGTEAQRSWQYSWFNNGVAVKTKTDLDNNLAVSYTYDPVGRQLTARECLGSDCDPPLNEGDLRITATTYDDAHNKMTVLSDLRSFNDGRLQTVTTYDELGRVKRVQKSDGAPLLGDADGIKVITIYSYPPGGRRVVTSSPHRDPWFNDPAQEWTCTQYDQSDRVVAVATFRGNTPPVSCGDTSNRTGITQTEYDAEWTTVTDPAQKVRNQRRDALGRLVEVVEHPDPGETYSTTYSYDLLGNLTQVMQGSQTRTFAYSSLSRLLAATNPESGTVYYEYHDSGDLKKRTDARGIRSGIEYDPLHRVRRKTYSDSTPWVYYEYHLAGSSSSPNIGQLESVSSSVAAAVYSYDALGKVAASAHWIDGYSGDLTFGYNWYLNGGLKWIRYPSGRLVHYDVDDAGRTNRVYVPGKAYADMTMLQAHEAYTADGRIARMKLGNNLWETREYRPPGSPTSYMLGSSPGSWDKLKLEYHFSETENNGNVFRQVITRWPAGSWTQEYAYDGVNRLWKAREINGFDHTYGYDRWGNRLLESYSSGPSHSDSHEPKVNHTAFSYMNNRLYIAGSDYDAAGNQTKYDPYTLSYDAEGRNTEVKIGEIVQGTYAYDGDGRRVKKIWTPTGGAAATTFYVYDALGQLAAEYSSAAPPGTGTSYPFADMLGSVRAATDDNGAVVECYDYLPFGRMLSSSDNGRTGCYPPNPDIELTSRLPQKFTGKERDAETGLDYFLARYYSGAQGRFLSPDEFKGGIVDPFTGKQISQPGPHPYADIGNPQSLNKYTYVLNNPLRYVDPDGHTWAEFFEGVADTTYRPIVQTVSHPIDAVSNIASALAHPIDTVSAIGNSVVETGKGALSGDSKSLGEVTGTVVSALVTAGAAKGISALAKGSEVAEVGSSIAKSFNPFKGKSAQEVGAMFEKKGFEARGPNPIGGKVRIRKSRNRTFISHRSRWCI